VVDQDFQTGGNEFVQATSDLAALVELSELEDQARRLARKSRSDSTWRAYNSDLGHFQAWCSEHHLDALPAEPLTVAMYLAALNTAPIAFTHGTYKHQSKNEAITEYAEIEDRGHSLTIDHGWPAVADIAVEFVKRFV
jgi:hypothetical protein